MALTLNSAGDLYITDTANNKVRLVTAAGIITTIVGTGTAGSAGDGGSPTSAQLNGPAGIAVSSTGVYYISDTNNNKIRKVSGHFAVVAWVETRT
jgi:DNA-binding beta-propeller fold protein YncE